MLYVGNFTFTGDALEDETEASEGYFTCAVNADDAEAALAKFELLIDQIRQSDDLFDGASDVFLESCAEIKEMPENGVLTYWAATSPGAESMISTGVRGATDEQAGSFFLGPDDTPDDDETSCDEPFLSFRD